LCRTRPGKANCPAGSADPPGAISSNVRHRFPAQTVPCSNPALILPTASGCPSAEMR
jgi:hypothetical protein